MVVWAYVERMVSRYRLELVNQRLGSTKSSSAVPPHERNLWITWRKLLVAVGRESSAYELEQYALGSAMSIRSLLAACWSVLAGGAYQLAQLLAFNIWELVDKLCQCLAVSGQSIPPLLDSVKEVARCSRLAFKVGKLPFDRFDIDAAHDFSDELHLPSGALATVYAGMHIDSDAQRVRKLQARSSIGFESRKLQPDFL